MELKLLSSQGQLTDGIQVSDAVFGKEYNEALIHQVIVAYQANARLGTRAQKNRRDVSHTTAKPWRQKGTGRARAGMSSSPLWRGGGRTFASSPDENFTQKINKKMYRAAMRSIYSQLLREGRLHVIEGIALEAPKTKLLAQKIKAMGLNSALMITDELDDNLYLASRNLAGFIVLEPRHVDPYSLVYFEKVVVTKDAFVKIEEMLK
jgi:large subunit ribosomal protein L4